MKTIALILCVCPWLLTGCLVSIPVPIKVGVCKDGNCVNFELPATVPVRESGKEVAPVQ
jgi:hypothetical protein